MPIDSDSLLRILLAERARVLAYIRAMVRGREMAEDVFQDVCVLALEKREQIKDAAHLSGWVRVTAKWVAMNAVRKEQARRKMLDASVLASLDAEWKAQDAASGPAMAEALRGCLDAMTDKARRLVLSRYTDGLSVDEIARQTARPVNSVYVTFSRIHSALADCVFQRKLAEGGRRG